jgi:predicted ferric reductase
VSYAEPRATGARGGGRPVTVSAQALWVAIVAGGLATIWLWWHDQPADLSNAAAWLTGAGRLTGLLAGYLIAVQLLLMSRAPVIDRGVGADRLSRWHAMTGRYTISLIVAHTLLIIWGYAAAAHAGVVSQTGTLLSRYPDVLMATVALGLFLGIAVVSAHAARARLRYETWYYLHLYTYLALGLSFAHVFADGNEFRTHPGARIAWATLYIGVAAVLFTYRVALPVRNALRHQMQVVTVRREAPGVTSLHIAGRRLEQLRAEPGQFFRWRFLTRDGWWQSHPFSLSAVPHDRMLRITVKSLGDYTAALQKVRPGTRVVAEGPYGAVTPDKRGNRRVLLLAGGVGITATRALAEAFAGGAPHEVVLLYRVNQEKEVVFRQELDRLAESGGLDVRYLVGPPGSAADVLVADRLRVAVPDLADREVFVCGPAGFVDVAVRCLHGLGVPGENIHLEHFSF